MTPGLELMIWRRLKRQGLDPGPPPEARPAPKPERIQPKKSKKKRSFEQTRVGFYIQHEAPIEFDLIMRCTSPNCAPNVYMIENIAYSSSMDLFKTERFWKALKEYRKTGLYPLKPMKSTPELEMYYINLRREEIKRKSQI
jgi:hypothetical protein